MKLGKFIALGILILVQSIIGVLIFNFLASTEPLGDVYVQNLNEQPIIPGPIQPQDFVNPIPVTSPIPLPTTNNLKVMSFNIHHGNTLDRKFLLQKFNTIANYIKDNNFHIVGLQEVTLLEKKNNIQFFDEKTGLLKEPDYPTMGHLLQRALNDVGYPMYLSGAVPSMGNFINANLSIFPPTNQESLAIYTIGHIEDTKPYRRRATITQYDTHIGPINFINTHIHHGEETHCRSFYQFYNFLRQQGEFPASKNYLADPNTIIVGDFNRLIDGRNVVSKYCSGVPAIGEFSQPVGVQDIFDISCSTATCEQGSKIIDWIVLPHDRELPLSDKTLQVETRTSGGMPNYPEKDHPNINATIIRKALPQSQPTPIPTPTPTLLTTITPTPVEELRTIDLNGDVRIDITDFALFVEYYKLGNVKIDYNKDGQSLRDIDDFNYFIQEYKEEQIDEEE
ncbi:hypothetical protein KBD45_00470 [Candidatus Dojkabacteria bacterium]|nr:hypothetical protein [Candidatus Dojkabacteria bacterium]